MFAASLSPCPSSIMIPCFTLINRIIMLFLNLHSAPKSILHFDECLPGKVLMKKEVY